MLFKQKKTHTGYIHKLCNLHQKVAFKHARYKASAQCQLIWIHNSVLQCLLCLPYFDNLINLFIRLISTIMVYTHWSVICFVVYKDSQIIHLQIHKWESSFKCSTTGRANDNYISNCSNNLEYFRTKRNSFF